jgi:hypothetical protein
MAFLRPGRRRVCISPFLIFHFTLHLFASHKPPATIKRLDAPAALIAIIEKPMKKAPAERYQSAAEIAEALQHIDAESDKG